MLSQSGVSRVYVGDYFPKLQKFIAETLEIFEFTFDIGIIWLNHFNWNIEKFTDFYTSSQDIEKKAIEIGVTTPQMAAPSSLCPMCCCETNTIVLECGHGACSGCFNEYVSLRLKDGPFMRCFFYGCQMVIRFSAMRYLPLNVQNEYKNSLSKLFIQGQQSIRTCPNTLCDLVFEDIHKVPTNGITCPRCRVYFCLWCKEGDHRPALCQQVVQWRQVVLSQDQQTLDTVLKTAKFCPKCREPIEKSQGCNHMTCRSPSGCRHEFCWLCLEPWSIHSGETGGFYNCNSFKNKPTSMQDQLAQNLDKRKSKMERTIFYLTRYSNHDKAESIAISKQGKVNLKIENLTTKQGYQVDELEFINRAYQFLLSARHVLKWTYAYAYYLNPENTNHQIDLFEFNQADFERACENLHSFLEKQLPKVVKSLNRERFYQLKQKIINQHVATEKFMQRFLNGLSF